MFTRCSISIIIITLRARKFLSYLAKFYNKLGRENVCVHHSFGESLKDKDRKLRRSKKKKKSGYDNYKITAISVCDRSVSS